ncbi:MAG: ComF family protein [Pseudanabaenaceae cyanobacterium]|jgi:predicted amidophosphoribosyltransferase
MQWLRRIATPIINAIWVPNCPMCQRRTGGEILCSYCQRQINACGDRRFLQGDHPIGVAMPLFSWGIYDGPLKRAIAVCKYDGNPNIAKWLGQNMGETWRTHPSTQNYLQKYSHKKHSHKAEPKPLVVSIPLHPEKLKSRGFNQAAILADGFCEITGLKHQPQLLRRIKNTKAQMQTTSKAERITNLAGAFAVDQSLARAIQHNYQSLKTKSAETESPQAPKVILVDDIYTTGTTINEAIQALAQSGISVGAVLVLSRPAVNSVFKLQFKPQS